MDGRRRLEGDDRGVRRCERRSTDTELTLLEFRNLVEHLQDADLGELDDYDVLTIDPQSPPRLVRLALPPPDGGAPPRSSS